MAAKARLAREGSAVWLNAVFVLSHVKLDRGSVRLDRVIVVDIDQLPALLTEGRAVLTPEAVVRLANAILRDGAVMVSRSLGTD
jgi:hypothetical protein